MRVHAHALQREVTRVQSTQSRGRGFGAWLQMAMASRGLSEDCECGIACVQVSLCPLASVQRTCL